MEKDLREKIAELEACRDANVQKKKEIAELKAEISHCHNDYSEFSAKFDKMEAVKDSEIARLRKALEEILKYSAMGISTEHTVLDIAQRALKGE